MERLLQKRAQQTLGDFSDASVNITAVCVFFSPKPLRFVYRHFNVSLLLRFDVASSLQALEKGDAGFEIFETFHLPPPFPAKNTPCR